MKTVFTVALLIVFIVVAVAAIWLWTPDRPRSKLEPLYLRAAGDMVELDGFRLHVRDTGERDAPAIVMLHGFGSSLHTFEAWATALDTTYRVIRFDLPGSGLSEPDPTGTYTDARSMELMTALFDLLGVHRAVLVGNSIGGRLAWRFAAEHPDRVEKLVLISPDGFASTGFEYGREPVVPSIISAMRYVLPKALLRPNIAAAYGDPDALTDATLERYYALMLAPGVRPAMIKRMEQTILSNPVPLLRTIDVPALLLWGEKDALIPVANAADYLRALPNARLVTLPLLGHVPHEEAPDVSLAPVREFLAE